MILEDLGYNPCETQPQRQKELIAKRIEEHRILTAKIENKIAFQIEVGVMLPIGCQVGSTYIPSQCLEVRDYSHNICEVFVDIYWNKLNL